MKVIGLIGGMSWESTAEYYRILNQAVKNRLGGHHSCQCLIYSVDFDEIEALQRAGDWEKLGRILVNAGKRLRAGGADFLVLATNTMHKVAAEIQEGAGLPLLHIADVVGKVLWVKDVKKVGLLGTAYTMEQEFYKDRLREKYNIEVLVPNEMQRKMVHNVIYNELVHGKIIESSKVAYLGIINSLIGRGADAILLGCTEISLLIKQADTEIKLYDSTYLHAMDAARHAMLQIPVKNFT